MGLLDGLFIAGLTIVTGGFDSIVFWVFPCLIVLNALSIPLAVPQIVLNLLLSLFYLSAGLVVRTLARACHAHTATSATQSQRRHRTALRATVGRCEPAFEMLTEHLLRVSVLWLLTLCCYGAQVLIERQRIALEEAGEFAARENQLHSAGRLAAEFAHQIKNPLAIINNAAFSLQRSLRDGKADAAQQIEIIQEEVARADRVITQITGYAQLSEGRVEKLEVVAELDRAIAQVFPPAVPTQIKIHREYRRAFSAAADAARPFVGNPRESPAKRP